MQSVAAVSPKTRGFYPLKWILGFSWLGRGCVGVAVLIAFLGMFFAFANWRGERAWAAYQRQLVAAGVELDWQKFVPAPVPDDQNFAMTPFLAPLFDFNPRPFGPGQTPWRDVEGHDRAANFAAALLPMDKSGRLSPTRFDGQMTDFEAVLKQLSNASAPAPAFPSREKAAAAVLAALDRYRPVLDELRTASARPYCRFNIEYDAREPMSILLPHYLVLQRVCRVLQIRAAAELAVGQGDAAFEDVKLMLFLANSIRSEPFLITPRVGAFMLTGLEQVVWEGLATHRWLDAQLRELQGALSQITLLPDLNRGLVSERAAFGGEILRFIRANKNELRGMVAGDRDLQPVAYLLAGPAGWFYQEEISYQRLFDSYVAPGIDVRAGQFRPTVIESNRKALTNELSGSSLWRHNGFSRFLLPNLLNAFQQCAVTETRLQQTIVACALERYRLANGKFPQTLDALVPAFIRAIPLEVCDGRPMKYRSDGTGQFVLYGVGWNEKDDHGTVVMNHEGTAPDSNGGDWVWPQYPVQ